MRKLLMTLFIVVLYTACQPHSEPKDIEKSYKLSLSQVTEAVKQEEVTGNQEETN
jgi:hypothetical protein